MSYETGERTVGAFPDGSWRTDRFILRFAIRNLKIAGYSSRVESCRLITAVPVDFCIGMRVSHTAGKRRHGGLGRCNDVREMCTARC